MDKSGARCFFTEPFRFRQTSFSASARSRSAGRDCGWFWLAGEPEFRERLSARLRGLEELAIGLVTDVHDKLNGQPPAPEVGATAGDSLPGAPPHRDDPIETSEDLERAMAETVVQEGGASVRGPVARPEAGPPEDAGRKDDSVVQVAFINDLAAWLKQGYAANSSGLLTVNLQEANLRYGVGMRGLAWIGEDLPAGRSAALAHVYTRDMLYSLYNLYIDRFMDAVEPFPGRTFRESSVDAPSEERFLRAVCSRVPRTGPGRCKVLPPCPDFLPEWTICVAARRMWCGPIPDIRNSFLPVMPLRSGERTREWPGCRNRSPRLEESISRQSSPANRVGDALALAIKKNGDADALTTIPYCSWRRG